jgi:hypothetical protein
MVLGFCFSSPALDRWAALSQIESRNNDSAIGAVGEISRYQVRREVWLKLAAPGSDWQKPQDALVVAQQVMKERCAQFEKANHRPPTDFEFYVLWNAPAQITRQSKAVRKRAERFCNLVSIKDIASKR